MSKEDAVKRASADLAKRLGVGEGEVTEDSIEEAEFSDMALGAGVEGEMSGQMMTSGQRIRLRASGQTYEYRTDGRQLRLYNFRGANHKV